MATFTPGSSVSVGEFRLEPAKGGCAAESYSRRLESGVSERNGRNHPPLPRAPQFLAMWVCRPEGTKPQTWISRWSRNRAKLASETQGSGTSCRLAELAGFQDRVRHPGRGDSVAASFPGNCAHQCAVELPNALCVLQFAEACCFPYSRLHRSTRCGCTVSQSRSISVCSYPDPHPSWVDPPIVAHFTNKDVIFLFHGRNSGQNS